MNEKKMPYDRLLMTECLAEDNEVKITALEARIVALETALARVAETQSDIRRRLADDERNQQQFQDAFTHASRVLGRSVP